MYCDFKDKVHRFNWYELYFDVGELTHDRKRKTYPYCQNISGYKKYSDMNFTYFMVRNSFLGMTWMIDTKAVADEVWAFYVHNENQEYFRSMFDIREVKNITRYESEEYREPEVFIITANPYYGWDANDKYWVYKDAESVEETIEEKIEMLEIRINRLKSDIKWYKEEPTFYVGR